VIEARYLDLLELGVITSALVGRDLPEAMLLLEPDAAQRALLRPALVAGDRDCYETVPAKGAALACGLVEERPLAGNNEQLAWVALRQFVDRCGVRWTPPPPGECAGVMHRLAAHEIDSGWLAEWIRARMSGVDD
jgi:prophage maintenance system killer protein